LFSSGASDGISSDVMLYDIAYFNYIRFADVILLSQKVKMLFSFSFLALIIANFLGKIKSKYPQI